MRDILEHLTNRWALWALSELGQVDQPLRFSELQKRMKGVTQKVLTQTLRMLESNGLVTRTMYAVVPPAAPRPRPASEPPRSVQR